MFSLPKNRLVTGVLIFVLGVILIGRVTGGLRPYTVPEGAMAPTLCPGDNILCEGVSVWMGGLGRGDVVVFTSQGIERLQAKFGKPQAFIMRLVGMPGDKVNLVDDKIVVNGATPAALADRTYVNANHFFDEEVVVPADRYLLLGDNSGNSLDSRYFGFVPVSNVHGRYLMHYWKAADRSAKLPERRSE